MADKKISALTASTTPLAGTEVLPIVQGASTVKVSVANLTAGRSTSVSELISDDGVQGRWTVTQDSGGNKLLSTTPAFGGWRTGQIQANGTGANMVWGSDGNTTVGVGNLVLGTAAKGIDFSANPSAAGMTSELLNDYEEGTWTPTDASGAGLVITITAATTPTYVKIGRLVVCSADVTYPVTVDASVARLSLPFAGAAASPAGGGMVGFKSDGVAVFGSVGTTGSTFLSPVNTFLTNANLSGVRFQMTWTFQV